MQKRFGDLSWEHANPTLSYVCAFEATNIDESVLVGPKSIGTCVFQGWMAAETHQSNSSCISATEEQYSSSSFPLCHMSDWAPKMVLWRVWTSHEAHFLCFSELCLLLTCALVFDLWIYKDFPLECHLTVGLYHSTTHSPFSRQPRVFPSFYVPENSPALQVLGTTGPEEGEEVGFPPLKGCLWKLSSVKNQRLPVNGLLWFEPGVSRILLSLGIFATPISSTPEQRSCLLPSPIDPSYPSCIFCPAHTLQNPSFMNFLNLSLPLCPSFKFVAFHTLPLSSLSQSSFEWLFSSSILFGLVLHCSFLILCPSHPCHTVFLQSPEQYSYRNSMSRRWGFQHEIISHLISHRKTQGFH